jgi:hypothetical protein
MHLCEWYPDGINRCDEPASKCVRLEDLENADGLGHLIWLCDGHYSDALLSDFWRRWGLRPVF